MSRDLAPRARALQMNAGAQIQSLLNPLQSQDKPGPGKAINHAQVNRQNLKATQVRNQLKREEEHIKATEEPFKMQRFKQQGSVVMEKAASYAKDQTHQFTKKGEGKGIVAKLGTLTINRTGMPGSRRANSNGGGASGTDRRDSYGEGENIYSSGPSQRDYPDSSRGQENAGYGDEDEQQYQGRGGGGQQYEDGGRFDEEAEAEYSRQQQRQQRYSGGGIPASQQNRGGPASRVPQHQQQPQYDDDDESINALIQQANHQQSSAGGRKVPGLSNMPGSAGIQRRAQQQPPQQQQQQDSGRSSYPSEGRSFIAENAKKVIHQSRALASARQQQQQDESKETSGGGQAQERSIAKHENFGKVPAYLQEAKSHLAAQKAAVEEKQKEKELGIPPGMVLMPEDQRLKTLAVLNENHAKVLHEISCFPLRVETISRKKAKAELEAKLQEIEGAITLFSRKRVLIQP